MDDLDLRLIRSFVIVAEELHFGRAAQRLYKAQQAVSRDINRLENRLGTRLLNRTTRSVELTPVGRRMLGPARELLHVQDTLLRELRQRPATLTVDVVGEGLTPALVLERAREIAPGCEFFARFHTGAAPVEAMMSSGVLDVTFGRALTPLDGLRSQVVRYEPIAVLLPDDHPLTKLHAVPLAALSGTDRPCFRAGNHATAGWDHLVRQLLTSDQIDPTDGHPQVQGPDEMAQHVKDRRVPILTMTTQPPVNATVLRPVVDPTPIFPWVMSWNADLTHPGIDALSRAVDRLIAENAWLDLPDGAWLPPVSSTGATVVAGAAGG